MSNRVQQNAQAQRLQQQRQTQAKTKAQSQEGRDKFSKALGHQKAETGEANKQQKMEQSKTLQRQAMHGSRLSHQGAQAGVKFHTMLHNAGQQNIKQGESQTKTRGNDMKENEITVREAEGKETVKELNQESERVEALDRDGTNQGGAGGGGFSGDSGREGSMQGQGQAIAGANAASRTDGSVQGANVPQIPEAILQELVKRVMVGVDKNGIGNFVIQLKEDVLGGATLQISAKDGKITAKFTVNDENIARLLKASEGQLARAFGHKGLSLESLEVVRR